MKAIINAVIVVPEGLIEQGVILIDQQRIAAFGPADSLPIPAHAERIDAAGLLVGPGFVDIHCHGGGGHMAYRNPSGFAKAHLSFGTTSILPTFSYNESEEEIVAGLHRVLEAQAGEYGSAIAGIHMEGPYINPKYGAITSPIRAVNPDEYREILRIAGDQIKVWTLAPELDGQDQFMREAGAYNIAFSVGHSEAAAERVLACEALGLKIGCHCTNASGTTPSPTRYAGTRELGVDEAVLLSDTLYAEVIPDQEGRHVRPLMLRLILKAKGRDRVIIITDAWENAGLPGNALDVNLEQRNEHSPPQASDYMLSGSLLTMDAAVRNMHRHTGASMADLFTMAALNPARVIGIDDQVGSIAVGKRANLVFATPQLELVHVMFEGNFVRRAEHVEG